MQTTLFIRVVANASSNRIGDTRTLPNGQTQLTIYVTAVAEKGKANQAVIRLLAEHLQVPTSRLTILRGETSRTKVIGILPAA